MKNIINKKLVLIPMIFGLLFISCDKDFPNPNNPTEEIIFGSKDGLFALSVGLNQYFTTTALRQVIEAPGITTRELGVTNTFLNIITRTMLFVITPLTINYLCITRRTELM